MLDYSDPKQRSVASSATVDLNLVRLFVQVADDSSFTIAARKLGVPKSSVSRGVAALERALGVRLLQRTTRALNLTDAGRDYLQQVRPALQSLAESAVSLRELGMEPRGRVRASFPVDTGEIAAMFAAGFRRRHPNVSLELSFSPHDVDLVAEGFDVALHMGALKDSSLVARKVQELDLQLYASPDYVRLRGAPQTVSDLAAHDCIATSALHGRAVWVLSGPGAEEARVKVQAMVSADAPSFAARAAAQGLGVALLPMLLGADLVRSGELVTILPGWKAAGGALSIVSPSRVFEPRAVTLFKDELAAWLYSLRGGCNEARAPGSAGYPMTP